MIPTTETPNPSDYAHQKLHKGDWIELWYFTQEDCLETAKPSISIANDTFSITTEDSSMVQLWSIALSKASRNALPGTSLMWDQIYFAGKVLIRVVKEEGWPSTYVNLMVDFFCRLDYKCSNLGHDADNALIEYQATACKQWFDTLRMVCTFDIAEFNNVWFQTIISRLAIATHKQQSIESKLTMDAHRQALVSTPSLHTNLELTTFSLPLSFHPPPPLILQKTPHITTSSDLGHTHHMHHLMSMDAHWQYVVHCNVHGLRIDTTVEQLCLYLLWNSPYFPFLFIIWSCGYYYKVQGWTHGKHMLLHSTWFPHV